MPLLYEMATQCRGEYCGCACGVVEVQVWEVWRTIYAMSTYACDRYVARGNALRANYVPNAIPKMPGSRRMLRHVVRARTSGMRRARGCGKIDFHGARCKKMCVYHDNARKRANVAPEEGCEA